MEKTSPQASTEEFSLQDNLGINRLNLEKGLRNRPNQYVLVDRGILLNPGKAYSDKMHQLDIAKKRDRLKKKIENRPEREELVRKLILQEECDGRKDEIIRIKQILDSSINTRPGSLELVDKNILQVDRLLASKVHNGDISYPKVCLDDIYYESNPVGPLPSISEDIQISLNDLSDILSQSSGKSANNKSNQISYKKTCRVGRYSFHNIEFRPAAQKAREFQQNELLEYEKIQAQHDPSLKRVHSELTMKSRKINDNKVEKWRSSKYSLLHRLNIHELKSECKLRMISCSNIPKIQLVEKLLSYEAEILRCHTSFDQCRNFQNNKGDRRSIPIIPRVSDFYPPDLSTQLNLTPPPYMTPTEIRHDGNVYADRHTSSKICHSISEPIIQDSNNFLETLSPIQLNVMNNSMMCYNNIPSYNNCNSKNSCPLLYNNFNYPHQSCGALFPEEYGQQQIKPENLLFQSQPQIWNNYYYNNVKIKTESSNTHPMSLPEDFFSPVPTTEKSLIIPSPMDNISNHPHTYSPMDVIVSSIPINSVEKFDLISKEIVRYRNIVKRINHTKHITEESLLSEYISVQSHLVNLIKEMMNFINMELKFSRIDQASAAKEKDWLISLHQFIINGFNHFKPSNNVDESRSYLGSSNGLTENNNDSGICQIDDLDMEDFLMVDSNIIPNQPTNNALFPKNNELDALWNIKKNDNELKTPETPFSDLCNSPMSTGYLDQIMSSLFNSSDDPFLQD